MAEVIGTEQLIEKLSKLGANVTRQIERKVLRRAAKMVQVEARRLAPQKSGDLKKSLKVRAGRRSRTGQSVRVVSSLPYAKAIEFGRKDGHHPAQPFLGPALEKRKSEIMADFGNMLKEELAKL